MSKFEKGHIPWNKGKTGVYSDETLKKIGEAGKGRKSTRKGKHIQTNTGRTHFKKGQKPWNAGKNGVYSEETLEKMSDAKKGKVSGRKGKKFPEQLGDGTANWAGDDVSKSGLHHWVVRRLGQPDTCEHCGKSGLSGHQIHWSNKDHKYRRKLEDWQRLCHSCHNRHDVLYNKKYAKV